MVLATAVLGYYYFAQDLPPADSLKNYKPKTVTFFYGDDGRVIGEFSHERRIVVPLAKIPLFVREAFISAEDANFFQHSGIDLISIARAFVKNVEAGRIVQGGSTITQQVTRSFLLTPEKSYGRKIREALLAFRIENNLTKDEILFLYLNQIYLGHGAYGVESAAELYFDKHVDQLTIAEAALLAGLAPAPSLYSPFNNPVEARARQEYTISRLVANGYITKLEAESALSQKLVYVDRPNVNLTRTPYFTEHIRRVLEKKFGVESLYNDGLKVFTTVNIEMQAAAGKAMDKGLREFAKRRPFSGPVKKLQPGDIETFLRKQNDALAEDPLAPGREVEAVVAEVNGKAQTLQILVGAHAGLIRKQDLAWTLNRGKTLARMIEPGDVIKVLAQEYNEQDQAWHFSLEQEPQVQSALMCLDLETGAVKAMIGGKDFRESQFNRAVQSRRQPGSAFKPIIYTAAMDNGFTPGSILIDSPIVYDDFAHDRRWKPINYDGKFYGPTDLYTALVNSRNVVTIKLLDKVGVNAVIDTAKKLGITSPLERNLSLALGSSGVSLAELITAFSAFPNLGERVEPMYITRVEDRDGNVIDRYSPVRVAAISPQTASVIQHMLRGVVDMGTGTRIKALGRPAGGKTGTTNDLADAWFVGFTPEYVAGVWVGLDEVRRMGFGESGGRAAAPIFLYFMQQVLEGKPIRDFQDPEGVEIISNGASGICYKEGTVGRGYSEVAPQSDDSLGLNGEKDL
ncbi:MAG: PBP1A family penicillin-binding protein [Pseudomonadota bacterium]